MERALTFDDVILVPQYSNIESRSEVDVSTFLGTLNLKIPILSANMDSVTGREMALAMAGAGGLGVLHRYTTAESVVRLLEGLPVTARMPSVGIKPADRVNAKLYRGFTDSICIDVAHGDSKMMLDMLQYVRFELGYANVMAGNVATGAGAQRLGLAGANIVKVGVGNGSACVTRVITGHGVPQISAIRDARRRLNELKSYVCIVADGGIRNSGDIVKALAAGAEAVMLGGPLAGTDESPAAMTGKFRGMASEAAQLDFRGEVSNGTPEGVSYEVEHKGPVADYLKFLCGGIRSGLSYSGCRTIQELHETAEFMEVTHNGYIEGTPHGAK
jgi:IMP dehydrogenase